MNCWAIWIDIEGFSKTYPKNQVKAHSLVGAIMEGILDAVETLLNDSPNRIFAYQTGDGFIISSEFGLNAPELPLGLGIFLLKRVLNHGGVAKCGISSGGMSDIQGCFPERVQKLKEESGFISLGEGVMTTFPVMGTALINSHRIASKASGALLIWDNDLPSNFSESIFSTYRGREFQIIDWIHSENYYSEFFMKNSKPNKKIDYEKELWEYISSDDSIPDEWRRNTLLSNRLFPQKFSDKRVELERNGNSWK